MKPDDLTHPRVTAARSDRHYPVEGMGRERSLRVLFWITVIVVGFAAGGYFGVPFW